METIKLNVGESGTVKRGKYRGSTAKVLGVNKDSYACQIVGGENDGEFAVIGDTNFRTPEEPTVKVRDLAAALTDANLPAGGQVYVTNVLAALEIASPGITEHIGLVHEQAE